MPLLSPNSVKALKGKYHIPWTCLPQAHLGVFQLCLWPLIAPGYLGGGLPCLLSALLYTPTTWFSSWPKNKHSSNRHHSWTRVVQGPPANATVNGSADTLDFQLKTKNTGSLVHVSQWSDIISHEQSAVQSQTMITMISTAWRSCSEQNRTYTHYSLHQNKSKTDWLLHSMICQTTNRHHNDNRYTETGKQLKHDTAKCTCLWLSVLFPKCWWSILTHQGWGLLKADPICNPCVTEGGVSSVVGGLVT